MNWRLRAQKPNAPAWKPLVLRERVVKNSPKKFQFRTGAAAFTAALLTAAVMKIAYVGYTRPAPVQHPTVEQAAAPESSPRVQPSAPKEEEFNQAISRLQEDFDSLPEGPAQIVAQVNTRYPGHEPCPLQWPNGNAALFLLMQRGHSSSLLQNINQCADAIEKLYDEREAAILRQTQTNK